MSIKYDTVTPVVRLQLLLAYWQDIYFGQLTEMVTIFLVFKNLIWTMTESLPKNKKKKHKHETKCKLNRAAKKIV